MLTLLSLYWLELFQFSTLRHFHFMIRLMIKENTPILLKSWRKHHKANLWPTQVKTRFGICSKFLSILYLCTCIGHRYAYGNDGESIVAPTNPNHCSLSDQILKYQNKKDDEQQPFLDYVLDITVAYPQGKPLDLPTIVTGTRDACQTYFYYRLYHSSEVRPTDPKIIPNEWPATNSQN